MKTQHRNLPNKETRVKYSHHLCNVFSLSSTEYAALVLTSAVYDISS